MAPTPRFERPASNARNPKIPRYDAFGPKIARAVMLFGSPALLAWTSMEADPEVDVYCERPLVIPGTNRAVDFWVRSKDGEYFVILLRQSELPEDGKTCLPKKVQAWVDASRIKVVLAEPEQDACRILRLKNWGLIIRDLSAFSRYVPRVLVEDVRRPIQADVSLEQLERDFEDQDPVLVRVALFSLLHQGLVRCSQLEQSDFNSSMTFAPA